LARCKYGKLKNPSGKRRCKRKAKHGKAARKCRFGKLKNPTGKRICKRKRGGRKMRHMTKAQQEAAMWRSYRA